MEDLSETDSLISSVQSIDEFMESDSDTSFCSSPRHLSNIVIDSSLLNDDGTVNFHEACSTAHLDIIKHIVAKYQIDINSQIKSVDFSGFTPLHFAIKNRRVKVIKYLVLDLHADFTIQDARGQTALHLACYSGKKIIMNWLLQQLNHKTIDSCLKNIVDDNGLSIFHIACSNYNGNLVKRFINTKNINLNARINDNSDKWPGYTALHIAIEYENGRVVKTLLKFGADPNIVDKYGKTPLHLTCRYNDDKIKDLELLSEMWFSYSDPFSLEELIDEDRDFELVEIVRLLIQFGANVNAEDSYGKTPLLHLYDPEMESKLDEKIADEYLMFGNKRYIILDKLLKYGADIDVCDINGLSFFQMIAECFNYYNSLAYETAISVAYKRRPSKINIPTSLYPLQTGTESEYSQNENSCIKEDNSRIFNAYAVILSICNKKTELGNFIANGLDMNFKLQNGKNVLHVLCSESADNDFENNHNDRNNECLIVDRLKFCISYEKMPSLKRRFNLNWDLNARDYNGCTPLHYAALRHHVEDVSLLVNLGADLDIVDNIGRTPLDCCSKKNCEAHLILIRQVRRMIKFGCCMNQQNKITFQNFQKQEPIRFESESIKHLKEIEIIRSMSLFDLLIKSTSELIPYVKNTIFLEWLEKNHLRGELSFFVGLLRMQSLRTLAKLPFMESAKESLNYLMNFNLPNICSEKIIDFLDYLDMEKLEKTKPVKLNLKRKQNHKLYDCKRRKCE